MPTQDDTSSKKHFRIFELTHFIYSIIFKLLKEKNAWKLYAVSIPEEKSYHPMKTFKSNLFKTAHIKEDQ